MLIKGAEDVIIDEEKTIVVRSPGGRKRCAGMGDILAGVVGACSLWDFKYGPPLASRITRMATRAAFEKEGRGLTAPAVIGELAQVVKSIEKESADMLT